MNYTYTQIEDRMKTLIKEGIDYLNDRPVKTIPAEMDVNDLSRMVLPQFPAILLGLAGMERNPEKDFWNESEQIWHENYLWYAFILTKNFRNEESGFQGDGIIKGAYEVVSDLVSIFQGVQLLNGMDTTLVLGAQMMAKSSATVIYKVDIQTGQDRRKAI